MLIALVITFGAVFGSYLATLVLRWPVDRTTAGRSMCDHCSAPLAIRDLVPVFGFIANRGRCRICNGAIDWTHPAIELGCAAIGGAAVVVHPGLEGVFGAGIGWILLALAVLDLRHFWLPNRLTAMVAGLAVLSAAFGISPSWADRAWGGAGGFAVLVAISAGYQRARNRPGMGKGDPKLFGAIGLWLGWQSLPLVMVAACATGLVAVAVMGVRGGAVTAQTRLPLGSLIALAAFAVWLVRP